MTNADLKKEWEAQVALFRTSGKSIPKWCAAQDLIAHQFRYWLRKLETSESNLPNTLDPETGYFKNVRFPGLLLNY